MKTRSVRLASASRGVFLTLDVAVALMLLFVMTVLAFSYFWGSQPASNFSSQLLRNYEQDTATVLLAQGYLSAPLASQRDPDASGIRKILHATPDSVCMQVEGYGIAVPDGLMGYWKLNEGSGSSSADYSGNGNMATLYNGSGTAALPQFAEGGPAGTALSFDGANFASVPYSAKLEPSEQVSVAAWATVANWSAYSAASSLVSKADSSGYALALNVFSPAAVQFSAWRNGSWGVASASIASLSPGWHFFAGTYDGSHSRVYIDGALMATSDAGAAFPISYPVKNSLIIGAGGGAADYPSGYFTNGSIAEVRVYSRALSASEVSQLYSNPSNLLYVADKPECTYSGGEIQALRVPFSSSENQIGVQNDYAILKAWTRGAG